ncbi:MAG: hypothetical protein IJF06_06530 [Bacteroidaceae bacterium]|nr:hypothetical protein [Bacteroidaceae bacterium]
MRIHKLIKNTALLAMAFPLALFTSCSDGHEDDITDSDGDTEVTNDYTATTNVKNAVITDEYEYIEGEPVHKSITIYEDFNHRYILQLVDGDIEFVHYTRKDGSWYNNNRNKNGIYIDDYTDQSGIINCGKVSSIDEIETKSAWYIYGSTLRLPDDCHSSATVQPYNGYSCAFITEDGLINNMRIFVTEYTLDSRGRLESINIEYQLF